MTKTKITPKETEQTTEEKGAVVATITLPNRSALWNDANTASGYDNFIPAGTYPVAEVKDGFTLIKGKGWVHCVPDEDKDMD